jgi:flagellar biosynthesis/type III secretory pathway protein FliH
MAHAATTDSTVPALALSGPVVKRETWARLGEVHALFESAAQIRRGAQGERDAELARAHAEGIVSGRREGLAQVASELLRVQAGTRALLAREHARIADLACAVVARIAPRLEASSLVAALVEEAVREIQAEHYLQVHVHPDALAAVEAERDALREAHPGLEQIVVVADAELDVRGCVLISESGKIEAGLDEQLAALRMALRSSDGTIGERA